VRHVFVMFVLWFVFLSACLAWWGLNALSDF
jgi:hypothetical protein